MTFGITAIGTVLSVLMVLLLPTVFTSTTTLMPPDNSAANTNLLSLLSASTPVVSSVGSALLGVKSPGGIFIGVLGSRTVQQRIVDRFDLIHVYKKRLAEDACKALAANTHISEDQKSGIISISVDAKNPTLAAQIAQAYVAELDDVMTHNSTSAARRERVFLEGRLSEVKKDLDDSSRDLSEFSTKSKTIDVSTQAKDMVDAGLKLQAELVTADSELAALRQTYTEDNFRVRAASARVAELQRQMNKLTGSAGAGGGEAAAPNTEYPSISQLPALGLVYEDLDRRVKVDEALWEALTKQYELAKVQEAREVPTVRVLDIANTPQRKSFPARSALVILGALLSFLTACIVVAMVSFWEGLDAQDERKKLMKEISAAAKRPTELFGPSRT